MKVRSWLRAPSYRLFKAVEDNPSRWFIIAERVSGAVPPGPIRGYERQKVQLADAYPPAFVEFANLARVGSLMGGPASAEAFANGCVAFARKFGLLGLSRLGVGGVFGPAQEWPDPIEWKWIQLELRLDARTDVEPLMAWDTLAHQFYEALVASGLQGEASKEEQARWLWRHRLRFDRPDGLEAVQSDRDIVAWQDNAAWSLAAYAQVRLRYEPADKGGFLPVLDFDALIQYLAYEAVTALAPDAPRHERRVRVCECGTLFSPRHGNAKRCPACAKRMEAAQDGDPMRKRFRALLSRYGLSDHAPAESGERERLYKAFTRGGRGALLEEARRMGLPIRPAS